MDARMQNDLLDVKDDEVPSRYLSREQTVDVYQRILRLTRGGGHTSADIDSRWTGNLRWARNRITTAGETTDNIVRIVRIINGAQGSIVTNKLDDESLKLAIASAESMIQYEREDMDESPPPGVQQYLQPKIWSESTLDLSAPARSAAGRELVAPSKAANVLSAGYIEVEASTRAIFNTSGMVAYYARTRSEYSVTARNASGTGSGWAGVDTNDWSKIDAPMLSKRALEKCLASADPRAIEPGRYTVILEPQAVHDFFYGVVSAIDRQSAEQGMTAFTLTPGQSKIGLKVFDERITVSSDPMDPECGYIPFNGQGYPYRAVTWIKDGVLKELAYDRGYALHNLGHGVPLLNSYSYKIHGGQTSIEEMIATTRRGLIVTRFDNVGIMDSFSLLSSGLSRDGLWLIENGRIKHPAKNMRFIESPMAMFNNLEQIGVATRVYAAYPTVVPAVKVRDFNFSSMTDAV